MEKRGAHKNAKHAVELCKIAILVRADYSEIISYLVSVKMDTMISMESHWIVTSVHNHANHGNLNLK